MKKTTILLAILLGASTLTAQQVNTLYFLENSPMRHTINPALAPVSDGYVNLPVVGWTGLGLNMGNLTLSDMIYQDANGQWITALKNQDEQRKLIEKMGSSNTTRFDFQTSILNFGFRVKEKGYVHIGINQKLGLGIGIPSSPLQLVSGDLNLSGGNSLDLSSLRISANTYTEVSAGYSRQIGEKLSVGGKAKFLLGGGYADVQFNDLSLTANDDKWVINGEAVGRMATPVEMPQGQYNTVDDMVKAFENTFSNIDYKKIRPAGYGAALDLGVAYEPIEHLQISLAVTDLGFMYWANEQKATVTANGSFSGLGEVNVNEMDSLGTRLNKSFEELKNCVSFGIEGKSKSMQMISGKFNAGIDGNFCNNRIGVGVLNQMQWYNGKILDDVTIGLSLRPVNWFNLAVSYSLLQNAKYSDIGASISIMPYDGINLTLAADYIPTNYLNYIPYKTKGVNLEFGLSIVWGTNKKKTDKTGAATTTTTTTMTTMTTTTTESSTK